MERHGETSPAYQQRARRKVLVIPHQPHRGVRVRALEMARYLADFPEFEVSVLTWDLSLAGRHSPMGKLAYKVCEAARTLSTPIRETLEDGIRWVRLPHLLAPYPLAQQFNAQVLGRYIRQQGFSAVISANAYHFPVPKNPDCHYIYDVVDDHMSPQSGSAWEKTRAITLGELARADEVLTISHGLQEILSNTGFESKLLPNGVDMSAYQEPAPAALAQLRETYRLAGQFVIGYIGNHGPWAGMDFLLKAFTEFHAQMPNSRLLIVGPGVELPHYQTRYADEPSIIFTGPVPPAQVADYFHVSDIGVLPFDLTPFTHHALPLKVLEFGAARKTVIASPLKELETLNLPHIQRLPLEQIRWVEAFKREASTPTPWQAAWDDVIAPYDWALIFAPLRDWLEREP